MKNLIEHHADTIFVVLAFFIIWFFGFGCLRHAHASTVTRSAPPDFSRLVQAIYVAEGGARARVPYGIESVPVRRVQGRYDVSHARRICMVTVQKNWSRWVAAGARGDFVNFLGSRYAPVGAANDDRDLNRQWPANVRRIYERLSQPQLASN